MRLLAGDDSARTQVLASTHDEYTANSDNWTILLHAFEGSGGFADGSYLWPYRAETREDFTQRRKMARYHAYVETVIDLYTRHVFTQEPKRSTDNPDLAAWWQDVDGHGTDITSYLRRSVALALAAGHAGILMDATPDEPTGPAKADQRSRPFLTLYDATAILDWRTQRNVVTGVKLCEAPPEVSITDAPEDDDRLLLWDEEGWARFTTKGDLVDGDTPGLGLVPFEVLRPKPSILHPFCGRPLFSNAKIVQALFNRMSELDEVLRNQAFSLLTVSVGPEGDVESAKKQVGSEMGTTRALVVQGEADYISPDMAIPERLNGNISQIIRELYRVAHMRYERDSLQAESAEAIRLQFKELNEMLQGIASELQRVELRLARFFFAWTSPTPEQAEANFDAANVSISYPDEFFLSDLRLDLDAWAQAIAMDLGDTMTKRLKKKAVRRIEPEIPVEDAEAIDAEIDAQPSAETQVQAAANKLQQDSRKRMTELLNETSGRSG